jgi:hypothetical protein
VAGSGWLDTLLVHRGWLLATFHLDLDSNAGVVAHDYIRCGTPVSVGFNPEVTTEFGESGILHRVVGKLNEVSIIRSGLPAYRGAQVTHRLALPQRTKPAGTEVGEVFYTPPGAIVCRPTGQVIGVRNRDGEVLSP